jgi:hypothetical protein
VSAPETLAHGHLTVAAVPAIPAPNRDHHRLRLLLLLLPVEGIDEGRPQSAATTSSSPRPARTPTAAAAPAGLARPRRALLRVPGEPLVLKDFSSGSLLLWFGPAPYAAVPHRGRSSPAMFR